MSALRDLSSWLDEQSRPKALWYVKRLAANDTLASGGHQAGPYMAKSFLFDIFPSLNRPETENPDKRFDLRIDSHPDVRQIRAVWYNNKLRGGTRNEARLTGFGGGKSALLDPDSTGSVAVLVFHRGADGDASVCHAWVCDSEIEADLVEERVGLIEPGKGKIWSVDQKVPLATPPRASCWLKAHEIPESWRLRFPSSAEIIGKTIELRPENSMQVDIRLLKRRDCEFEIFRSLEEHIELQTIRQGFNSIDDFVGKAQTILQRRKARSGRSLELHIREIFLEEKLREGQDFAHQPESDAGKRPDFLFPSQLAYQSPDFPATKLRMLAVKTTCKDRWRQILNEADRVPNKHLLTLQEGVSEGQFREMSGSGVRLVVPAPIVTSYPTAIQPHLQTLESFIGDVRLLALS